MRLVIGKTQFVFLFQVQVHQEGKLINSVVKSKEEIPECEIKPGPSNISQSMVSRAASSPATRPLPMPRQMTEESTDIVGEIRKGTIA